MKILFLLTQLEVGGAQTRVMQTAEEVRRRGHTADVVFLYRKRDCFNDQPKIVLTSSPSGPNLLRALFSLFFLMRRNRYDVTITNTAPANILGTWVAMLAGIRLRFACQTQPPSNVRNVFRLADRITGTLGVYTRIIANSKWTATCFADYPALYRRRLRLVMNGLTPRVSTLSKPEAREELGLDMHAKYVVTVGRLAQQKGQDLAMAAMRDVDARLIVIGEGELRTELERERESSGLSDRVVLLGEVPGEEVGTYLRAADVFVFPSRWETFGLAALEAAASGLPIVANDLAVLREVLQTPDRLDGALFVEASLPSELASGLARALYDVDTRISLSDRAMSVANRHSLAGHVDSLLLLANQELTRRVSAKP